MENSIYLGLSRQMAIRADMQITSNNIANMNTTGFRGQNLVFEEYLGKPSGHDDPLSFVANRGQYDITDPGSMQLTGNPLNVALEGPGFISIQKPDGEIAYTRDGNFQIDPSGILMTQQGFPVASTGGASITIPADSTEIKIDKNGAISNQSGVVGQIGISEFDNPQNLKPMGNNLYDPGGAAAQPASETVVQQGVLEGSNVNAVTELTRLIEISREYTSLQNLLNNESDRLRSAVQKLTESS
ncbi:MAG: flagellar basal-body rod protein FlgF [Alphaproteobacteria bacterium]